MLESMPPSQPQRPRDAERTAAIVGAVRSDASAARPAGPHRGLALLRFGIGGLAAVLLAIAGRQMQGIESVAGDSIAEAFYHAVGVACYGVAALAVLLGLPRHRG